MFSYSTGWEWAKITLTWHVSDTVQVAIAGAETDGAREWGGWQHESLWV